MNKKKHTQLMIEEKNVRKKYKKKYKKNEEKSARKKTSISFVYTCV